MLMKFPFGNKFVGTLQYETRKKPKRWDTRPGSLPLILLL